MEYTNGPKVITIDIRENDDNAEEIWDKPVVASLTLQFDVKKFDDGSGGLCSLILGAAAGIAGGINGVLGGLGSLALRKYPVSALGCNSADSRVTTVGCRDD